MADNNELQEVMDEAGLRYLWAGLKQRLALKSHDHKIPKAARFVVGTSASGWTANDCDYLCDGTADEAEINAAITALPSTGGEVVLLDGQYNLTGSILLDGNNITIRGNGNNTKLIRGWMGVYESRGMILIEADYCEVRNLYLDGVKGSYNDYYNNGIYFDSLADNGRVENCMFVYHGGAAILDKAECSVVTGNWFENNDTGVDLSYGNQNVVSANTFLTNDYCIKVGSDGNVIANNTMKTTTYYAIDLSSAAQNSIVGNVSDGAKSGLYASYGTNGVIVGNTFNNNTNYGIELSTGATGNTIAGNTCLGNTKGDVYVYADGNVQYAEKDHVHDGADITTGLDVLATAMGAAKIQTGSYTGTGTKGLANARSLTFPFTPRFVMIGIDASSAGSSVYSSTCGFFMPHTLPASYADQAFFFMGVQDARGFYAKWDEATKTLSWYHTAQYSYMLNSSVKYNYIAFG